MVYQRLSAQRSLPQHRSCVFCFGAFGRVMCSIPFSTVFRLHSPCAQVSGIWSSLKHKKKIPQPSPLEMSHYIFKLFQPFSPWICDELLLKLFLAFGSNDTCKTNDETLQECCSHFFQFHSFFCVSRWIASAVISLSVCDELDSVTGLTVCTNTMHLNIGM